MKKDKIVDILTELRPEFDFSEQVNFIEEGMLDSFDIVSLVDELENQFNIKINGVDVIPENFSSINSIISLLDKNGVE
jgi:acyl carrier protein